MTLQRYLLSLLLLLALAWPGMGWGQIAVTDTSTSTVTTTSTVTFAHVVASGDTAIYVGVGWIDAGAAAVDSVTWNTSENFTSICNAKLGNNAAAGWMIVNPTVGTLNIVVTWPEAVSAGVAGAISISGGETASLAAAHRTGYTNTGTLQNGLTVTVVDSISDDLVVDSANAISATMGAIGAGQTSRAQDDAIGGGSSSWAMSTEPATGGNTVMSWTTPAATNNWATCATALVPAAGAALTTKSLLLLGVGS